jgi:hypothetical protein
MREQICRVKRLSLRVVVHVVILGLALLLPTATWAGGHTLKVRPPNGVDDTAAIQGALDMAAASGPGITVQLAPGRYLTRQLLTFNFHGTFKGAGKDRTTIEALPNLVVDCPDIQLGFRLLQADAKNYRWPCFILFVDGHIQVSDLSLKITAVPSVLPYFMGPDECTALLSIIKFTGQHPMKVNVDRVSIEGRPDSDPRTFWGFNAMNGIDFCGDLLQDTPEIQYCFLGGDFALRGNSVRSVASGGVFWFFLKDSRVVIGGSPSAGNVFECGSEGVGITAIENSRIEVSHNRTSGSSWGLGVYPALWDLFVPAKASQFLVHDNHFAGTGTGPGTHGVYLMNAPGQAWLQARIYNNTIETPNNAGEGLSLYNTKGTFLWNNTFTGSGADAIGLWGSTFCTVLGNHLESFFCDPSAGLARFYLDPASSHNLVVCAGPLDTVLDEGTENRIIGGFQLNSAGADGVPVKAARSTFAGPPNPPRRKPPLR